MIVVELVGFSTKWCSPAVSYYYQHFPHLEMEFQSFDCLQSDTQTVSCVALYIGISGNLWLWFKSYFYLTINNV